MTLPLMTWSGWPDDEIVHPCISTAVVPMFLTSNHSPQLAPPAAFAGSAMISLITTFAEDVRHGRTGLAEFRGAGVAVVKSAAPFPVSKHPPSRRKAAREGLILLV